jgi:hypothetical protein
LGRVEVLRPAASFLRALWEPGQAKLVLGWNGCAKRGREGKKHVFRTYASRPRRAPGKPIAPMPKQGLC